MHEWPESRALAHFFRRAQWARRRLAIGQTVARGLAVAAVVMAGLLLAGAGARPAALAGAGVVLLVMAFAHFRFDFSARAAVAAVEAARPGCANLLVTAESLMRAPGTTPVPVQRVVLQDAAAVAAKVDLPALFPLAPAVGRLLGASAMAASTFLLASPVVQEWLPSLTTEASGAPAIGDVRVTITPPAYAGLAAETHVNPDRVSALTGSEVDVVVAAQAHAVLLETIAGKTGMAGDAAGGFRARFTLTADGYFALTPQDDGRRVGARRLVGLSAAVDRPPVPKIVAPGKDLFLRVATTSLALTAEATDDLALRSLRVLYTKVAGAGESFTFTEGEVPLAVTRANDRQWSGTGVLPLATMGLEVGDMVVYRSVAADARPGGRPVESDAFIVEIVSASEAMAEGFSIDDTRDKYALSQQMVILKTERLIAKAAVRPAPSTEAVIEEAMTIAAEQRAVRAELVFMMGGHFEDEFVEAAHEHEISDGRFDNSGRADLGRAVRDMSRAAAELTDGNLTAALAAEKAALEAMQRALSRRRFILRTLTQREAIDLSRRLTGTLADAASWRRAPADAFVPPEVAALREALALLAEVAGRPAPDPSDVRRLADAVEGLLKAAPGQRAVVDVVATISAAGESISQRRPAEARRQLAEASTRVAAVLREALARGEAAETVDQRRLKGALADVQRSGGGR